MSGLSCRILIAAALVLPVHGAQAFPFGGQRLYPGLIVPVADGCGINRYRDAHGVCRRKYILGGHMRKGSAFDTCGGKHSHRQCNIFGYCWTVCD